MFVNKYIFVINLFLMLYTSADGINEYLFGITISLMMRSGMLKKHQIEQVCLRREAALAEFPLYCEPQPDTLPCPSALSCTDLATNTYIEMKHLGICGLRQAGLFR